MTPKLKPEYLDTAIWIPFVKQTYVGRFIPIDLLEPFSKKFPEFFESAAAIETKKSKSSTSNALHLNDTISTNKNDERSESDSPRD